ncbi:MAG TPA: FtsL-like putative cell division protein [Bacteroidaceae bacterium]|nr:FtsL-like putative cell division protein [Bacteroidaceae bacterium]
MSYTPKKKKNNLGYILKGGFLFHPFVLKQVPLLLLVMIFSFMTICVRYTVDLQIVHIQNLKREEVDMKYKALSKQAELLEMSRESKVIQRLHEVNSKLELAKEPPYIIK